MDWVGWRFYNGYVVICNLFFFRVIGVISCDCCLSKMMYFGINCVCASLRYSKSVKKREDVLFVLLLNTHYSVFYRGSCLELAICCRGHFARRLPSYCWLSSRHMGKLIMLLVTKIGYQFIPKKEKNLDQLLAQHWLGLHKILLSINIDLVELLLFRFVIFDIGILKDGTCQLHLNLDWIISCRWNSLPLLYLGYSFGQTSSRAQARVAVRHGA